MAWSRPFGREELRVVLLGNVGSGKSASGNTLLGTSRFACKVSACPVTHQCEAETVTRKWGKITMVDTPGLTAEIVTDTKEKLLRCLQLSAPGPHVFLLVIPLGRFTQEEKDTVQRAAQLFKEHFYTFTIILFTFKDNLKNSSISDYISNAGVSLQQLLQKCGNRYHAFNNNNPTEDDQAEQLLRKMNSLVQDNFRTYYTLEDRMREERMEREWIRRMERARRLEEKRRRKMGLFALLSEPPPFPLLSEPPPFQRRLEEEPPPFQRRRKTRRLEETQARPVGLFGRWLARLFALLSGQARPDFLEEVGLFVSSSPVDLKEEFEKLKIRALTQENLKKQSEILDKWRVQLESKEKRLNDREEQVRKKEEEMEEKKRKLKEHLQELSENL